MKYSQLKEVFMASEVTVISNKWNITFSNSSRTVKMYWGELLKGSTKSWTGITGSDDFPVLKKDGEIIEIFPHKDEGFIKLKLSSGEEVEISCLFMDSKNSSTEELIWSTTTLSLDDVKWLSENHSAATIALECGYTMKMFSAYKESGLKAFRIAEAEILGRKENQFEIIQISPKEIPLKEIKGDVTIYRYKNSVEISVFSGKESVSYRTEISAEEPEQCFPDYYSSSGVELKPPKQFSQQLTTMMDARLKAQKRETPIPVFLKDGVLTIVDDIVVDCPIKSATADVLCNSKAFKLFIQQFIPKSGINSILFPSEPNGIHPETGKLIPLYMVIIYGHEGRNRFLIGCQVKTPFYYDSQITEGNKEREAKKAKAVVEKTAKKVVQQLDAIAKVVEKTDNIPFTPDPTLLTPEIIQEKKREVEAIASQAIRPLNRGGDSNQIKKWVVQAHTKSGQMLEIVYDIENAVSSFMIYEDVLLGLPAEKDTY